MTLLLAVGSDVRTNEVRGCVNHCPLLSHDVMTLVFDLMVSILLWGQI